MSQSQASVGIQPKESGKGELLAGEPRLAYLSLYYSTHLSTYLVKSRISKSFVSRVIRHKIDWKRFNPLVGLLLSS